MSKCLISGCCFSNYFLQCRSRNSSLELTSKTYVSEIVSLVSLLLSIWPWQPITSNHEVNQPQSRSMNFPRNWWILSFSRYFFSFEERNWSIIDCVVGFGASRLYFLLHTHTHHLLLPPQEKKTERWRALASLILFCVQLLEVSEGWGERAQKLGWLSELGFSDHLA